LCRFGCTFRLLPASKSSRNPACRKLTITSVERKADATECQLSIYTPASALDPIPGFRSAGLEPSAQNRKTLLDQKSPGRRLLLPRDRIDLEAPEAPWKVVPLFRADTGTLVPPVETCARDQVRLTRLDQVAKVCRADAGLLFETDVEFLFAHAAAQLDDPGLRGHHEVAAHPERHVSRRLRITRVPLR
jgi:hypothetical protein